MRTKAISSLLPLGLLLTLLTPAHAQSAWTTADDFTFGQSGAALGLAATDTGVVFSTGSGNDLAGVPHAYVRRTLDGGSTWSTVLDLPGNGTANAWAVTVGDYSGLVFATAVLRSPVSSTRNDWVTFRSADGGTTWSKVDVVSAPNFKANPYAVVEDPAGRVFVGGHLGDSRNVDHFVIRRSLDGGTTWATVDDQAPAGINCVTSLAATPSGVFAAGYLRNVWTVRRSTNGGATWTTVDSFQPAGSGSWSHTGGIAADTNGNLYVTGQSQVLVNKILETHWITRKSTDNGTTWRTVDDVVPGSNPNGKSVTVDAFGRVFATGTYTGVDGGVSTSHWVTRASVDGGATWITTDDLIGIGYAAAADQAGNVFTAGKARGITNPAADVRKLAAP